jgi:hypothetical protein
MQSILNNADMARIEQELRKERDFFALAFHRGKSMSDLTELVSRIHYLEEKLDALLGNNTSE